MCKIKNYRPVWILNAFSKICETFPHNCLTPFVNKVLSGAVVIDLPKVFDCIRRSTNSQNECLRIFIGYPSFMYFYLKRRKQNVKTNNTETLLKKRY